MYNVTEAVSRRFSLCQSLFFNKVAGPRPNFIKKGTLAQVFSCEFCKISKNTFFYRTHLAGASEVSFYNLKKKPQQNSVCISFNWQMRGTSSDNEWYSEWYNEWQQVTMNDNKWYNKWQWVVQWMTTNGKEWQLVTTSGTTSDKEWQ